MAGERTIHDIVEIIKNAQQLDTSAGGGDVLIPKHGETHVATGSDPVPPEIDGIEADMTGITDGDVPTYSLAQDKFVPVPGGSGTLTPVFDYVDYTNNLPSDPVHKQGRTFYDPVAKALSYYNDRTATKMAIGRELWTRTQNDNVSALANGAVVFISGVNGTNTPQIELALASGYTKDKSIHVLTETLPSGDGGEATRYGLVNDVNTSAFNLGDELYLSATTPGALTNVRPTWPAKPIVIGRVTIKGASGQILVLIEPDQFDYEFDGCAIERQDTYVVVDGGNVYAETELNGGGDLPVQLEGDVHLLDCTTGTGTGGRARALLTPGTDTSPQINFVYVELVAGVPTLKTSVTAPTGAFAFISFVSIWSVAKTSTDGPALHQRNTDAIEHDGRGRIAHICAKIRQLGATWSTGVTPTATITTQGATVDDLKIEVTSGLVWQLHPQSFPALDSSVDGIWVANASGAGTLTKYQKITNLNQCLEYSDGTAVGNGDRFSLVIWGAVNKTTSECKLFVNLSTKGYSTDNNGYYDVDGAAVTSVDRALFSTAFLICRIPVLYTNPGNGTLAFINPTGQSEIVTLLGTPLGASGSGGSAGGGGVSVLNDLDDVLVTTPADGELLVYENASSSWKNLDVLVNYIKADGTIPLTANWDAGGFKITAETLESDVATGTAPLTIASTTKVSNLNVDLLDDQEGSYYLARANHTGTQLASTISDFDTEVANNSDVAANTIHRSSNGSDHEYIDQSVVNGASPVFLGTNITAIPDANLVDDYIKANGTRELSANWDGGDYLIKSAELQGNRIKTANYDLRVTQTGSGDGYAYQAGILTVGRYYRSAGWYRSSGVSAPNTSQRGVQNISVGDASTTWQWFDVLFEAKTITTIFYGTSSGSTGTWTEFRDLWLEDLANPGVNILADADSEDRDLSSWSATGASVPTLSKQANDSSYMLMRTEGLVAKGTDADIDINLRPKGDEGIVRIVGDFEHSKTNAPNVTYASFEDDNLTSGVTNLDTFDPERDGMVVWELFITDGTTNMRSSHFMAHWDYSAGSISPTAESSPPDLGSTSNISFVIDMSGASGLVRLKANVASGTWKVYGTRKAIIPRESVI